MSLTLAALQRKKPATDEVLIASDSDQRRKLDAAQQRLSMAQIGGGAEAIETAEASLEAVKAEIRKTGIAFTLTAVGRPRWDELLIEHRPTEAMQAEDADKDETERRSFNPETFWPALLAESVLDSKLTAEQWDKAVFRSKDWTAQELSMLRTKAVDVNKDSLVVDLGN